MKENIDKTILILFFIILLLFNYITVRITTDNKIHNNIIIQDTTYNKIILDSIEYRIRVKDSIIYNLYEKYEKDSIKITNNNDTATVLLFKKLVSE